MKFVIYIELNTERIEEFYRLIQKLSGEEPTNGIKPIGVYVTSDGWGVDIVEAESEKAVFDWLRPGLPFFKYVRTCPAMTSEEFLKTL